MPIYVAKTYDGEVKSVILAESYEIAFAYWQGKGTITVKIETVTEKDLTNHPAGVLPIVHIE